MLSAHCPQEIENKGILLCGRTWLQVQGKCRGLQTCAVSGTEVPDPCVGTYKYAKAIYTCEELTTSGART